MGTRRTVKYKCPHCDLRFTKENLIVHLDEQHPELIPKGYSSFRVVFDYVNKKPAGYNGKCTECGGPTGWDENKGRYNRQCSNPKCKQSYLDKFEKNMTDKYGVSRISSTVEGQEKMLANRKISGKYKFSDGVEKVYTGSYEKSALEFLDKVMHCSSSDVITPGPALKYNYNGKEHIYISDIYYQPYNLIIEVKDGGNRPNGREMTEYREKQLKKEEYIISQTNYNYIRLTDNDLSQLMSVFVDLKMQMVDNTGERVIHINEAMNALVSGYMPGIKSSDSVYIVNYMQNNVFSGEQNRGYAVSDNIKLNNLIYRDDEGKLQKGDTDFLFDKTYDLYEVTKASKKDLSKKLESCIGEFVEEGYIYECIFDHKFYTYDQIQCESTVRPAIDYYKSLDIIKELTNNFIMGKPNTDKMVYLDNDGLFSSYHDIFMNEYYLISNNNSSIYYKSKNPIDKNIKTIVEYVSMEVK